MGTTDQSKLMFSIGLSDSLDSSSDDIPMQSRRKKRGFTRKNRNSRLSPSSSFLKTNYSYGLCTLFKFTFVVFILISMIIGMVVMYSLSKRMDSLQLSISGLQSTNKDLPDDLHSLHSKYKSLEQESTNLKINLNNVIITTSNLTQQTAQLHQKINQLNEVINLPPTTKQLPNDVEELKKIVADLSAKIIANNDSKFSKEQQVNIELRLNAFESKLQLLEQNLSTMNTNQSLWNQKVKQMISVINNQMNFFNNSLTNLSSLASSSTTQQKKIFQNSSSINSKLEPIVHSIDDASTPPEHNVGHIIKKVLTIIDAANITQDSETSADSNNVINNNHQSM